MKHVIFLCTGNSCRSQIAEGWARHLLADRVVACSAGTVAKGLDPKAVSVMAELDIDISGHTSNTLADLQHIKPDLVVTLCSDADANCPRFPAPTVTIHHGFDDPPRLAAGSASAEEGLVHYRRVRDEIRAFIKGLPERLTRLHPLP
jgi:arsenate reductase